MVQVLSLVGGVPRAITISSGGTLDIKEEGSVVVVGATAINFKGLTVTATDAGGNEADITIKSSLIYDRTLVVASGGISSGTPITLPNGGIYDDTELTVHLGGQILEPDGIDFSYVGTGPNKTQITLTNNLVAGDKLRFRVEDVLTSVYDETFTVTGSTLIAGTAVTLPSAGTYDDVDLKVYLSGQLIEPDGIDFSYVGAAPNRTQITLVEDAPVGTEIRFRIETSSVTIYDETISIGVGGVGTGVNIPLPNSGTFTGQELEVYLNGELMEPGIDWGCEGCVVNASINMTFDLVNGDKLRFRIDSLDTI